MLRKLTIVTTVLAPLVLLFAGASPFAWGQTANQGTIICCNQHIHVKGNWRGADRKASCRTYARTNARAKRELCAMQCLAADAKERYCGKETCNENPTPTGRVYAGVPRLEPRAQPSETADPAGTYLLYGTRLLYSEVQKVDGTTWYRVLTGGGRGWVSEEDVFCELPPPKVFPRDVSCQAKIPGSMFVMTEEAVTVRVYSEPTADSKVVAEPQNGTRLVYREIRENQGEKWFFVTPAGGQGGWAKESDLTCNRPGVDPSLIIKHPPLPPGSPRPTAAIASAGRG